MGEKKKRWDEDIMIVVSRETHEKIKTLAKSRGQTMKEFLKRTFNRLD